MNEHDPQAIKDSDIKVTVTTAQEQGMVYLWQAVTEQLADPEAMRAHVTMARTLLGDGRTSARLR
jgi:hypothetical protein